MSVFTRPVFALMAPFLFSACGGAAPSMDMNAPIPTEADAICAVRHPCSKVEGPTTEEAELCVAVFADKAADCRNENAALFLCSMRAARCDASGDIDDEATYAALEKHCETARSKLARCCESANGGADVHCELFRDEGDPVDDESGNDVDAPPADGGNDAVTPSEE